MQYALDPGLVRKRRNTAPGKVAELLLPRGDGEAPGDLPMALEPGPCAPEAGQSRGLDPDERGCGC